MSDVEKIVWGALGGVFVTVLGQLLSKICIEPIYALRVVIGEVRFNLSFHGTTINTPIGRTKENSDTACDALRKCSCELESKLFAVPFNSISWFYYLTGLPPKKNIEAAVITLRGLSTHVHEAGDKANNSLDDIHARVSKIENLLGM